MKPFYRVLQNNISNKNYKLKVTQSQLRVFLLPNSIIIVPEMSAKIILKFLEKQVFTKKMLMDAWMNDNATVTHKFTNMAFKGSTFRAWSLRIKPTPRYVLTV